MKHVSLLFLGLLIAASPGLRAREAAPTEPPPVTPAAEAAAPAPAEAEAATPAVDAVAGEAGRTGVSVLPAAPAEASTSAPAAAVAPAAPAPPSAPTAPAAPEAPAPGEERRSPAGPREIVMFGSDALLPAGERAREIVAIFGNVIADGTAEGETVAILGDVTVNGRSREAVAVLGNVTVNGRVDGDVVAVLGGVQLGPEARVSGQVVSIVGGINRAPGAEIGRGINQIGFGSAKLPALDGLKAWVRHCLVLGRPLAFADGLGWAWALAGGFLLFYVFLALVFGRAVETCATTLEQHPGLTIGTALLTMILLPVLTLLLAVTGVGPFVLAVASFAGTLFGKAALLAWMGRRVTLPLGLRAPVLATLIGGLFLLGFYLIPYVGFVVWKATGVLGLGMAVYTVLLAMKREQAARPPAPPRPAAVAPAPSLRALAPSVPPPPVPPVAPDAPWPASGFVPPPEPPPPPVHAEAVPSARVPMSALPRAGFWVRLGATALDVILIGMLASLLGIVFVPLFAIYCFTLWALKGTTIGGIVCGLKVVRIDDSDMDWKVALVRCLGSFLSLVVAGLGFIWVAFDEDRQSWHDKIAGTTIVRVPKGTPLI